MSKYIACSLLIGIGIYKLRKYFAGGVCKCSNRLDNKVVVLTGGNSGIGKALAFEIAKRGAIIVLACRNVQLGLDTVAEILQQYPNAKILVKNLDLSSLSNIREFTDDLEETFTKIDALVNCAGIFHHPQYLTADGFEITFQTNYLGPFALTCNILHLLDASDNARIVNVASEAHRNIKFDDLTAVTRDQNTLRSHFVNYGASKLALMLFTNELANQCPNTRIVINSVNPGNVETAIYRHFPLLANKLLYILQWPIRLITVKTPKQGCQTLLHALLTSDRISGKYYSDCKLCSPSAVASDEKLAFNYFIESLTLLQNCKTYTGKFRV